MKKLNIIGYGYDWVPTITIENKFGKELSMKQKKHFEKNIKDINHDKNKDSGNRYKICIKLG